MKNSGSFAVGALLLVGMLLAGCGGKDDAEQANTPVSSDDGVPGADTKTKAVVKAQVSIDLHPGKTLHDANCISCHDAAVYTREDRKIADFPKLVAQVKRCDANLGSRLFDEEIEQVADYLNQAYYKYAK